MPSHPLPIHDATVSLDRDVFMRSLIRELSGTLQDVIGLEDAAGFVSIVGQRIGDQLNSAYREALSVATLDAPQVADVLVDLKRRIDGGFRIDSIDEHQIVLSNTRCPFGEKVIDRPALCMMTSNVFGSITAENLGYARVVLRETIARGAPGCTVVVQLHPPTTPRVDDGREYFAR